MAAETAPGSAWPRLRSPRRAARPIVATGSGCLRTIVCCRCDLGQRRTGLCRIWIRSGINFGKRGGESERLRQSPVHLPTGADPILRYFNHYRSPASAMVRVTPDFFSPLIASAEGSLSVTTMSKSERSANTCRAVRLKRW